TTSIVPDSALRVAAIPLEFGVFELRVRQLEIGHFLCRSPHLGENSAAAEAQAKSGRLEVFEFHQRLGVMIATLARPGG
ncbi:MAG: hypothetical protein KDA61_19385, partial [Planctomycetales bacterium]|nr:hypothetical protein [Planctomycetales bacterium]